MKKLIIIVVALLVGLGAGLGGFITMNPDKLDELKKVLKIGGEEAKKLDGDVDGNELQKDSQKRNGDIDENEHYLPVKKRVELTGVQVETLAKELREREKKLLNQEEIWSNKMKVLAEREKKILDLEKKITKLYDEIAQFVPRIEESEQKNIKKLAKMFETMSSEAANPILAQMPDKTIVNVLSKMKPRGSAKILSGYGLINAVNARRAAKLTEMLKNLATK